MNNRLTLLGSTKSLGINSREQLGGAFKKIGLEQGSYLRQGLEFGFAVRLVRGDDATDFGLEDMPDLARAYPNVPTAIEGQPENCIAGHPEN